MCLCVLTAYNGSLCEADADGCLEENCYTGVNCTDVVAPGVGANCSNCPTGLTGDGATCTGKRSPCIVRLYTSFP